MPRRCRRCGLDGHILVGGYFTSINSSSADPYMTSLNPTTGKDDGFLHLNISGNYNSPRANNATRVYNQQLSNGGTLDLVEGDFTSVGGLQRQQIFMLNLAGTTGDGHGVDLAAVGRQRAAAPLGLTSALPWSRSTSRPRRGRRTTLRSTWRPLATTRMACSTGQGARHPRTGLCDWRRRSRLPRPRCGHLWINYTGCDSLYAAAADSNAAYFAGHQRWTRTPTTATAWPGRLQRTGHGRPAAEYRRPVRGPRRVPPAIQSDRGLGADDMLVTSAGLWIASDNFDGSQMCGGVENLSGICFLPYS